MRFLYDSKHAARVTLGVAHARRNISLARKCNDLVLRSMRLSHITFHYVFCHAGNADNECADTAASLGMKGFASDSNVSSFCPERFFSCSFEIPRFLTQIAEVLNSFFVQSQLG